LNMFQNVIYSCDVRLNVEHHYSSLKCHKIILMIVFSQAH